MHSTYTEVITLIRLWSTFREQDHGNDVQDFGRWLLNKKSESEAPVAATTAAGKDIPPIQGYQPAEYTLDLQLGRVLARVLRFTAIWTKKAFHELPIRTMDEYGMLKYTEQAISPKKTELVQHSLLESTTCFEILKRFKKQGITNERFDDKDKRTRRVFLTEKGQHVVRKADKQTRSLSNLLMGDLADEQKKMLLDMLTRIDNFHQLLYEQGSEYSFEKVIQKTNTDV